MMKKHPSIITFLILMPLFVKGMEENNNLSANTLLTEEIKQYLRRLTFTQLNDEIFEKESSDNLVQKAARHITVRQLVEKTHPFSIASLPHAWSPLPGKYNSFNLTAPYAKHHPSNSGSIFIDEVPSKKIKSYTKDEVWNIEPTREAKAMLGRFDRSLSTRFKTNEKLFSLVMPTITSNWPTAIPYQELLEDDRAMKQIYWPHKNKIIALTLTTGAALGALTSWLVNKICNSTLVRR